MTDNIMDGASDRLSGDSFLFRMPPAGVRVGTTFLCRVPDGWDYRLLKDGNVVITHPEHALRNFDPTTKKWSEYQAEGLVEMDPQP